ncbi:hypothetical protein GMORB2_2060 [Geosmithia morbida]|uniref:Uncharacterized protein n=1 Tax=Geosmithia morbida TaxID=1094350 RepID=A0A9P5D0I7_9HYPO|nr:uncharacterized protein GMORB2_2060 [Geosmithia morbida]KAF4121652.1 hypothetical protein GMORB2_2060 [Geosmithia morbida]
MDLPVNPLHAERARRKSRSSTNLNHLTLAPLTTKMPFTGHDQSGGVYDNDAAGTRAHATISTSYIEGRSAPTTPRLLSRTPGIGPRSHSHHRTASASGQGGPVTKSKSTTQLHQKSRTPGATTPKRRAGPKDSDSDSDWLFRTGALISTEAREFKGQAWLVSRQSSTSLVSMKDEGDDRDFERELDEEKDAGSSRRGSSAAASDHNGHHGKLPMRGSRLTSRANSATRRSSLASPMPTLTDSHEDSYFGSAAVDDDDSVHQQGPDFINLDERLEQLGGVDGDCGLQDDEAAVRRLVRRGKADRGTWLSNVFGWTLFSVEEDEDDEEGSEEDEEEEEEEEEAGEEDEGRSKKLAGRSSWAVRHFEGVSNAPDERIDPPKGEEGPWGDAAWLLSVATKVMF